MPDNYSYRNLIVWDKAQELTLAIVRLTAAMPRTSVVDVISKQIIRSSLSIAANIAEGHGRFTPGAHLFHLSIAKGSTCETDSWLDLLRRTRLITAEQEAPLHDVCLEIIAMPSAKIRQLENVRAETSAPKRGSYVREEEDEYVANPDRTLVEEVLGS